MARITYQKLEPEMYTAEELLSLLKKKRVILEVRLDLIDHICELSSYAYTRKRLHTYQPTYYLERCSGLSWSPVHAKSVAEWTADFLSDECQISVENESYFEAEYQEDLDQIKVLLSKLKETPCKTELYLSGNFRNFRGPLEYKFITWWLKGHPGYHTDVISVQNGDFKISEGGTLLKFTDDDAERVVIPETIRRIGEVAFFHHDHIKEVILPEGLLSIGNRAFCDCEKLERIHIPASVQQIEAEAFSGCRNLKSITLPPSLRQIKSYTFQYCFKLATLSLPESLEVIGRAAFQSCSSLEELHLPAGVKRIGAFAFSGCEKIKNLSFPQGLKVIGDQAFSECTGLELVSIPKTTKIGFAVFEGCQPKVEALSSNYLISNGKLSKASRLLSGVVKVPDNVQILEEAGDPDQALLGTRECLRDNEDIKILILPENTVKAEEFTLPRKLEYLIVLPSKKSFWCDSCIVNFWTKIVFHCNRDIVLESIQRWDEEPMVFVSFPSDKVLIAPNNGPMVNMEDQEDCYRLIIQSKQDIERLADQFHLREIPAIMDYLSDMAKYLDQQDIAAASD